MDSSHVEHVCARRTADVLETGWAVHWLDGETAAEQMAIDERLAAAARPTLRLFRWNRPAISLGLKQAPPPWVNVSALSAHGIDVVRRPTGGGIALHGSDVSCSVVAPLMPGRRIGVLMDGVASLLCRGLRALGVRAAWERETASAARITYCLTERSPYALMVDGRKLGGLAIRRTPVSWLIQGSLLVRALPEVFGRVMPMEVRAAFQSKAISLEEAIGHRVDEDAVLTQLMDAWPLHSELITHHSSLYTLSHAV
jgi:lipoate-protein ligase A